MKVVCFAKGVRRPSWTLFFSRSANDTSWFQRCSFLTLPNILPSQFQLVYLAEQIPPPTSANRQEGL